VWKERGKLDKTCCTGFPRVAAVIIVLVASASFSRHYHIDLLVRIREAVEITPGRSFCQLDAALAHFAGTLSSSSLVDRTTEEETALRSFAVRFSAAASQSHLAVRIG
jgi:hypothetical protein